MTIRKGEPWGEPGPLREGAPVAADDAAASAALQVDWHAGGPTIQIGLLGGDLHRTLGDPHHDEADLVAGRGMRLPMDLGTVSIDGGVPRVFVAHMVATARRNGRLWGSRTVTAMNGSFLGADNLGPRAHPNDGRLDVVDGTLPRTERATGRRRAATGTHLPHPDLVERRTAHHVIESARPLHVRLDGLQVGSGHRLEITCHPDAWIAVA